MTTLLKKLSAKNVCGNIVAPPVGVERKLMILMGIVKSYEIKATVYGDSTAFQGDFKGIDTDTGEEFRSGVCYLPDVAESLLRNVVDNVDGGMTEFAFEIGVVGVKGKIDGEVGKYEYRCKPLMKASENDPILLLEERLKKGLLDNTKAIENKNEQTSKKKGG